MDVIYYPAKCRPPLKAAIAFDRLKLQPGKNDLTSEKFEALKNHPDLKRYVDWGAIVLPSEPARRSKPRTPEEPKTE